MEIFGLSSILFCEKTMVLHEQLNDKKLPAPADAIIFLLFTSEQHRTGFMSVWSCRTVLCGGILSKNWLHCTADDDGDDMDRTASPFSVSQPGIH